MSARFDRFQVNLSSNELLRSGTRIPFQEQPFQILRLLLQAEGEVVTREEIHSTLMGLMIGMDWAADSKSVWLGGNMGRGAWGTRSGILNVDLTGKVRVSLKDITRKFGMRYLLRMESAWHSWGRRRVRICGWWRISKLHSSKAKEQPSVGANFPRLAKNKREEYGSAWHS
jgi:hypothetical protein